jgi:class 3 adenylate cyclase/tetratricopeptide (TPR) repeat protein
MAACPRCGERNPEAARFCAACGRSLEPPPKIPLETRKTVTVLFCDVTGSTTMGERQDPEQVRRVMSRYFEVARDVLERHGGTVEKFMGDAVMAVFGIPILHEDDALRALRAAHELRDAIASLNDDLERVYGLRIAVRIGVNSGEVIAGDTLRGHSFAAGDAVNVAQRLEAAAEAGEILIGELTHTLARDAVRAESTGPLQLKGREEPVTAFRLLEVLPGVPSHVRRFDSPMIGRERERQVLADAFRRAVAERSCHLFTVLGAAGVGKSRLVREAVAQVGDDARLLVGTCLPYGEGITFWPVLEVVKQGTGIVDGDSAEQATAKIEAALAGDEAARLAAERVAALIGLEESGETAEQGFWGFRKLVEALARQQPTILVFDDVHSGEPRFLDLAEHLAETVRDVPLLVVCMARPELLEVRPLWAGGKRNATTIFLEPLSREESRALLGNLLTVDVHEDLVARIQRSAEGNPLFVEEMVSMLIDGGFLAQDGNGAADVLERLPVPASIQVLLASRLDQLDGGERRALERAAVEGAVFHSGAVEALADDDLRGQVHGCLDALVRKELISPDRASFAGDDAFRFRHILIREAAYEAVPKQIRADLHERYAAWLEEVAGDRLSELDEVLGYHLEQAYRCRLEVLRADDHGRALALRGGRRLAAAGRRALARGDMTATANLLERAQQLLAGEDAERVTLLPALGLALTQTGELSRADEILRGAVELAVDVGDRRAELDARVELLALVLVSHTGESTDALLGVMDDLIPRLEELGDDRVLARAWYLAALARYVWRCRFADGERTLNRALEHALRARDRRQQGEIHTHLWYVAWAGPMPVLEAIDRCNDVLREYEHDRVVTAGGLRALSALLARRGLFEEARAELARARAAYDELGWRLVGTVIAAIGAYDIEVLAGDYATAEHELRVGYEALGQMGDRGYRAAVAGFLSQVIYAQGRYEEAECYALACAEGSFEEDVWEQVLHRGTRAKVLAQRGDRAAAETLARGTVELCSQTDGPDIRATAALDLAEVLRLSGRFEEAAASVESAIAFYVQKGNVVAAERSRALLAQ